ncbi:MAG: cobalamin biosynthesis protein [Desulfonauticus sp.]|nr:cobalamin biosynthesis protein [Desulfonauticus sp.]
MHFLTKKLAIITLSKSGYILAQKLKQHFVLAKVYTHQQVRREENSFVKLADLIADIFPKVEGIVFIGPCGIAVRSILPHLQHKTLDPAVVVVDVGARWAISLVSGHEGGANNLAYAVSNILYCLPVITTTSEAQKDILAGIGCKRGVSKSRLKACLLMALDKLGLDLSRVRHLATIDLKKQETGLLELSKELDIPLLFLPKERLLACWQSYNKSQFVYERVGVFGVAEPACLVSGHFPELILEKTICKGVSIALARESCMSLV